MRHPCSITETLRPGNCRVGNKSWMMSSLTKNSKEENNCMCWVKSAVRPKSAYSFCFSFSPAIFQRTSHCFCMGSQRSFLHHAQSFLLMTLKYSLQNCSLMITISTTSARFIIQNYASQASALWKIAKCMGFKSIRIPQPITSYALLFFHLNHPPEILITPTGFVYSPCRT